MSNYAIIRAIKPITKGKPMNSAAESGFTNIILDSDGFVRRTYTIIYNG